MKANRAKREAEEAKIAVEENGTSANVSPAKSTA